MSFLSVPLKPHVTMPTIGNMIKQQFMGAQGKRNLAFIRAKGKAWMPKLTRKIEGKVKQGRKWIDQLMFYPASRTQISRLQ